MTLQKQIIETLLTRDKPFFIFTKDTHHFFMGSPYRVDPSAQTDDKNVLLCTQDESYQPSARLIQLGDMFNPDIFDKLEFESEAEKQAEIDRILKVSGFTNNMSNRKTKEEEVSRYFELLKEKREEERDFELHGPKIYTISLDEVKQIRIDHDDKLLFLWRESKDKNREPLPFNELSDLSDERLIKRYKMDNPVNFTENIKNCIERAGKENYLSDLIPSHPDKRKEVIDKFLEDEEVYSFLKSVDYLMTLDNENRLKKILQYKSEYLNEFRIPYERAKLINAVPTTGNPRIECGRIHVANCWAAAMANNGRFISVDIELVFGKSPEEIKEVLKPMMIEHYHKASGKYKEEELTSYVYCDLCGNKTTYSLDDLGLSKEEADE